MIKVIRHVKISNVSNLVQKWQAFSLNIMLRYNFPHDLLDISKTSGQNPWLWKAVQNRYENERANQSRRKWLKKMGGEKHFSFLMDNWKKHIEKMVPDPRNVHQANYENHAMWLMVTKELNPPVFQNILAKWKVDHKRRKNLWRAIKEVEVDV